MFKSACERHGRTAYDPIAQVSLSLTHTHIPALSLSHTHTHTLSLFISLSSLRDPLFGWVAQTAA